MKTADQIRILIVEDEFYTSEMMWTYLSKLGYSVLKPVTSGEEAVTLALQEKPDFVMMDVQLSGPMNGIEAAIKIMDSQPVQMIFMTGYSEDRVVEACLKLNPTAVLSKPVLLSEVKNLIREKAGLIN